MSLIVKYSLFLLLLLSSLEANQFSLVSKENYITSKSPKITDLKEVKGDYLIASPFAEGDELTWMKKFNIVELGNVEDNNVNATLLKKQGLLQIPHHIAYDWMPALYYYTDGENRDFVEWLYQHREKTTLNPEGPFIHCKENHYDWCREYYYNLGNEELFDKRVADLLNNMQERKFNGIFFDWAPAQYILDKPYKEILSNFKKLNPKLQYFDLVEKFYKTLKKKNIFVVTNQGFRQKQFVLPYVTYDMTESYITTDVTKKIKLQLLNKGWVDEISVTNYYPIYDNSQSIADSLKFIDMLTKYKKEYKKDGFKNFIYLNYIAPDYEKVYKNLPLYKEVKPKNAIYFSYAMAKLTNNLVYAEIPTNRKLERDEIYFYDLGAPLGESYEKIGTLEGYIRFYEKGFVLVCEQSSEELYLKIQSPHLKRGRTILDTYSNIYLKSQKETTVVDLKFQKDIFTHKNLPLGRVYLYL